MATATTSLPPSLRAFHGDPAIKEKYLTRVQMHRAADEIISGQYWQNGKGCAVGCTLHSSNHGAYETELGIPRVLARLEDGIFERTFHHDPVAAKEWPEQFLSAPKVGADLSLVWPAFAHWLMVDEADGVIRYAKSERSRESIRGVAELFRRWLVGSKPTADDFNGARRQAAAAAAAYDYAAAAATYAAATYDYAADAADAAADYAGRKQTVAKQRAKLLALMSSAE